MKAMCIQYTERRRGMKNKNVLERKKPVVYGCGCLNVTLSVIIKIDQMNIVWLFWSKRDRYFDKPTNSN